MLYYITAYGPYILKAVVVVLVLAVIICTARLGISVRDMLGVKYHPFRRKKCLYLLTAVYFVVCAAVFSLGISQQCSATLSFNYEGASHGLNPNQTRFNQADILGEPVLEKMIGKNILPDVTAEDLAEVLHISSEGRQLSVDTDADSEDYRVCSEYQIQYAADKNTGHLDGEDVLQVFAGAYQEWYAEQSTMNLSPLSMDFTDINEKDYLDICDHLDIEANRIINFMTNLNSRGSSFQSEENGEGFNSINTRASNIKNTLVADLRAYILAHSISKDTQDYLGRLSTENIFLDFDARKEGVANETWLSVINQYEDDMARIVLVPTYDTDGQFYMSQTEIGVDDFAEAAEEHSDQMVEYHNQIAENNYVSQQLSAAYGESGTEYVDLLIEQIESELTATAERARQLIEEYEAKQANGYMTITIQSWESRALSVVWKSGVLSVLFLLMLHAICFLFQSEAQKNSLSRSVESSVPDNITADATSSREA